MLQIWDTAGQEKFQSIGSAFYRGSDACVLVYDITNETSFERLENWKTEFIKQGGVKDPNTFPFIVLGNKCDKQGERAVELNRAQEFCEKNGNMPIFETSAKDDMGIGKAFEEIVRLSAIQHQEDDIYIPPQMGTKPFLKKKTDDSCKC